MGQQVDFVTVSTEGLESSPVAPALAGLRANEARYFKNKYDHDFTVEPAAAAPDAVDRVSRILAEERDIVIDSEPLEVSDFTVDGVRWTYVFYDSGLSINVLYSIEDGGKAGRRLQAVRRHGSPRRVGGAVQVRAAEVQAGGDDQGLVLRHQGRVLSGRAPQGGSAAAVRPAQARATFTPGDGAAAAAGQRALTAIRAAASARGWKSTDTVPSKGL